jgi:hypothetical protein
MDVQLLDPAQGVLVGERVGHDRVSFVRDPVGEAEAAKAAKAKAERTEGEAVEEEAAAAKEDTAAAGQPGEDEAAEGEAREATHSEDQMHAEGRPTGALTPLSVTVNAGQGLAGTARHIIGCNVTQGMRVHVSAGIARCI